MTSKMHVHVGPIYAYITIQLCYVGFIVKVYKNDVKNVGPILCIYNDIIMLRWLYYKKN